MGGHRAPSVAVDVGRDTRRICSGSRPKGLHRRHWQVPQSLWRLVAMKLQGVDARLLYDPRHLGKWRIDEHADGEYGSLWRGTASGVRCRLAPLPG